MVTNRDYLTGLATVWRGAAHIGQAPAAIVLVVPEAAGLATAAPILGVDCDQFPRRAGDPEWGRVTPGDADGQPDMPEAAAAGEPAAREELGLWRWLAEVRPAESYDPGSQRCEADSEQDHKVDDGDAVADLVVAD